MNRKKGFTLVELLAVIAILAIILTILAPSLLNGVKSKKEDALNKIYDLIELAARNYVMDYDIDTPTIIQMEDLCKTNYIDCPILNPETEEELDGYVFAGKHYFYGEKESIKLTVDLNGGEPNQTFNETYAPGTVIELQDASKENAGFAGWKVVKGNSTIEGNTLIIGTTDTEIKAIWGDIILVDIPIQNGTLTYDGNSQSPSWNNYDTSLMTISGDTSGTNAGTYLATFTLPDGYGWEDGTINPKTVEWNIAKAKGTLSLSESSGTIGGIDGTITFTVIRAGDGKITATSSNTSVATVSISGTVVTVKGIAAGATTITVSVADGENYAAPANKIYSVNVEKAVYLYKPGDFCASVSGGWIASGRARNVEDTNYQYPPVITNTDNYLLIQDPANTVTQCRGIAEIVTAQDLTNVSYIELDYEGVMSSSQIRTKFVVIKKGTYLDNAVVASTLFTGTPPITQPRQIVTLDVSSLTGEYSIGFVLTDMWSAGEGKLDMKVYSLRMVYK